MEYQRSLTNTKIKQYFLTQLSNHESIIQNQQKDNIAPSQQEGLFGRNLLNFQAQTSRLNNIDKNSKKTVEFGNLSGLLKENKSIISKKNIQRLNKNLSSKQTNKYHRISINDNNCLTSAKFSSKEFNINADFGFQINPSINKLLSRVAIETFEQGDQIISNRNIRSIKSTQKRRKCMISTQKQFDQECQRYIQEKDKQQASELFRKVNREMKLYKMRNEPQNYYQQIRKSALKKIDYMSYNQKYYDDEEVKHLLTVVDNCNVLIHKKVEKQNGKSQRRLLTAAKNRFRHTEIQKDNHYIVAPIRTKVKAQGEKFGKINKPSKMLKISFQDKAKINEKINDIVKGCQQQQKKLSSVKTGMKIFEFYCGRIDEGFEMKGRKLDNFMLGEQQS